MVFEDVEFEHHNVLTLTEGVGTSHLKLIWVGGLNLLFSNPASRDPTSLNTQDSLPRPCRSSRLRCSLREAADALGLKSPRPSFPEWGPFGFGGGRGVFRATRQRGWRTLSGARLLES